MGALQHGLAMEGHQRMHEAFVGARADAEDYGLVATLRRQIGMTHRRIDVDRFTFLQHDRVVKLGMNLNPSLEHVDQLLALVADELAELLGRASADPGDARDHPLTPKLRAQIVIILVRRFDPQRALDAKSEENTSALQYLLHISY